MCRAAWSCFRTKDTGFSSRRTSDSGGTKCRVGSTGTSLRRRSPEALRPPQYCSVRIDLPDVAERFDVAPWLYVGSDQLDTGPQAGVEFCFGRRRPSVMNRSLARVVRAEHES